MLGMQLNPYEQAILQVGHVLQAYDSDQKYPVYGFGAKVRTPDGSWSPCQVGYFCYMVVYWCYVGYFCHDRGVTW